MIKHKIKKLSFIERKWIYGNVGLNTNPCLEIVLPVSNQTVNLRSGLGMGELGVLCHLWVMEKLYEDNNQTI